MMTSGAVLRQVGSATIGLQQFRELSSHVSVVRREIKRMKRSGLMLIKIETSRVLQEVREIDGIQENMEIEFNMEHGSIDGC